MTRGQTCSVRQFTLIEVLSVVAIIMVLAGLLLGVAKVVTGNASEAKAKAMIEKVMFAMQEHYQDRGYYPRIESITSAGTFSDGADVPLAFDYDTFSSPTLFRVFRIGAPSAGPPQPTWATSWPTFHHSQTGQAYMENMQSALRQSDPAWPFAPRTICLHLDPWQKAYYYTTSGVGSEGFRVWSMGPDKTSGTADDICSWKKR